MPSSSQGITEEHAQRIHESREVKTEVSDDKGAEVLIGEADGSMIPVVETTEAPDRRKSRQVGRREARLCMVREPGNVEGAIAADLPIGSGEIESGHRYVIQQRLKPSGAWWKHANAEHMIALRVVRANNEWEHYWQKAA
jgi:hypothetical protein